MYHQNDNKTRNGFGSIYSEMTSFLNLLSVWRWVMAPFKILHLCIQMPWNFVFCRWHSNWVVFLFYSTWSNLLSDSFECLTVLFQRTVTCPEKMVNFQLFNWWIVKHVWPLILVIPCLMLMPAQHVVLCHCVPSHETCMCIHTMVQNFGKI